MPAVALPPNVQHILAPELDRGEVVLWVGQPGSPAFSVPWISMFFSLFPIGFGVMWLWELGESANGPPLLFRLAGLLPLCIGLMMIVSPFWNWWRMKQLTEETAYVITDRRVIVVGGYHAIIREAVAVGIPIFLLGNFMKTVTGGLRFYGPDQIEQVQRVQHGDGRGDVYFRKEFNGKAHVPIGFHSVENAKEAEGLLNELAAGTLAGRGVPAPAPTAAGRDGLTTGLQAHAAPDGFAEPVSLAPTPSPGLVGRPSPPTWGPLLPGALVVVVVLAAVYFLLVRPMWFDDVTGPPGKWSERSGPLTLDVTKVTASPSRFRVWMVAKNEGHDKLGLPIFGYFFVVDEQGRQYEAAPFVSTWPGDVAPGATITGYAEIQKPLPPDVKELRVGFTTVFGSFGVRSITVKGVRVRR